METGVLETRFNVLLLLQILTMILLVGMWLTRLKIVNRHSIKIKILEDKFNSFLDRTKITEYLNKVEKYIKFIDGKNYK